MRLKYQMRGLGIGMVVTAIIMGVTTGHAIPLTDAEIRARALELGMVESNSLKLSDVAEMSTPVPEEDGEADAEKTQEPENGETDGQRESQPEDADRESSEESQPGDPDTGNQGESHSGENDMGEQTQSRQEGTDDGNHGNGETSQGESDAGSAGQDMVRFVRDGDMVTVIIESGADSYMISKVLAQAGLVGDAGEYDDYLCDNLYSRKIVSGNYEIPMGASEEEIAKIITLGR